MTSCCFCLSIRTGCFIGSAFYFIIAFIKLVLLIVLRVSKGPETVIVTNVLLLTLAGVTLLIGTIQEDRVCIITFLCFNICAMVTQDLGLLILYLTTRVKIKLWILVVMVIEQIPFIYMIAIGIVQYRLVKEKHLHVVADYYRPRTRGQEPHEAAPHAHVPALAF
ncbi:uncharacterized protein LOC107398170 [Tribolium castaneum]|uniref:Uncharacterized protein n=1 Tax=Tribolium castaneum TaxID=7070 RepID=D6WSV5_TRICA|nr:PREDICTED: uncharacterized protein LOC107398170 [Tribolium castaneum]EFA06346.2 hypothetical protein TcasGA2_TC009221 [Tribolium castaneum]|eukprot:XP_015836812.1 PREDICTED: uncharacterized protein LOC107398170 [Tribolium castaneum]